MEAAENTTIAHQQHPGPPDMTVCEALPDLTRLRYFHGQMLAANDLQAEQDYFKKRLLLHNRCLHGYGTVCGLKVVPIKEEPSCDPKTQEHPPEHPARVLIECGLAIDCEGNELAVRQSLMVDLWQSLSEAERKKLNEAQKDQNVKQQYQKPTLYLSLCYCVQPIDPVRPVLPDACGAVSECVYSKLRDSVRVLVSTEKPHEDHCRNNCCEKCKDKCLLLAAIDFEKGKAVTEATIHNEVRRWISLYEPVTITGINWSQGAAYTTEETKKLLQQDYLTIHFSRPVLTETITDGVVDLWVIEGGLGRSGNMYHMAGQIVLKPDSSGNVSPATQEIQYRQTTRETLQEGDRLMIIVRTDFILDECCRPVDGNHVGGRVPDIGQKQRPRLRDRQPIEQQRCPTPPQRYGPWVSGNGSAGGSFESWFYIKSSDEPTKSVT